MIAKHLSAGPVPPSQRANIRLPAELEELVLACLAKEPEDRPSAAELSRSLAAVGCGTVERGGGEGVVGGQRFERRHRRRCLRGSRILTPWIFGLYSVLD